MIPLKADTIGFVDFITLVGASAFIRLLPMLSKKRILGRGIGILLALLYVAYMVFTVTRG